MSRNDILTELYYCDKIDECISRMIPRHNQQDFKQEIFLIIAAINESLLFSLYKANQLRFYIVRTIINQAKYKYSKYNKVYADRNIIYDTDKTLNIVEQETEVISEEKEMELINKIDNMDEIFGSPAYRMMVILVDRYGSQREVSKQTGVSTWIINRGIKRVRKYLQNA